MLLSRTTTVFCCLALAAVRLNATNVYGSSPTAQSVALGGIYLGSTGPTDALASNPALLTTMGRPYLEITGVSVLSSGNFRNSTPYPGSLQSTSGLFGSAALGFHVPHTRLSIGLGTFPVSLLSARWQYQDPAGTAGASYGLRSSKSAFLAIQSSVGVGFQISSHVSIGAAFGIVNNINTLEMPYIFQTNATLAGLKTLLNLHTSGVGYNGTVGLMAEPARNWKIGLAYKTRTTVRSTGTAEGDASAQFAALGIQAASTFHYNAQVDNVFPQSASISLGWQPLPRLHTYLQGDWLNWSRAFTQLPVHLTGGDNVLLNTLLKSTTLDDSVPLHWKDQFIFRGGFEVPFSESVTLQGAYAHANSPIPGSTLTPLTASIMSNALSTGIVYQKSRYRLQVAYQVDLPAAANVGASSLLAGEYSNTRTSLYLQTLAVTTGIRF